MNRRIVIGLFYEQVPTEIEQARDSLHADGFACQVFNAGKPGKITRRSIGSLDMLLVFNPTEAQSGMVLGLAEGLQKTVIVLATPQTNQTIIPRHVKRVFSNRQLLNEVRKRATALGKATTFVHHEKLDQYGVCPTAVDWFETRFPKGTKTTGWTEEIQRNLILNGGAPWVQGGEDFGFVKLFSLEGANYSQCNLNGLRLEGLPLRKIDFSNSVINEAKLSDSDLTEADFEDAILEDARFHRAAVKFANFSRANLNGVRFDESQAFAANFTGASCQHTIFHKADLTGATFDNTILHQCSFRGAILDDVDFTKANLKQVDFRNAKINLAIFSSSQFNDVTLRPEERKQLMARN